MAAYATVADVRARINRTMSTSEETLCATLLDDAGVFIDSVAPRAGIEAKQIVSCRMVMRQLGNAGDYGVPMGATQGSMSGLGYSQSWTISGGSSGELYLSKTDRRLLGLSDNVGSYSPVQEMAPKEPKPGGGCIWSV